MSVKQPSLLFKVQCTACYGEETWKLPRIVRKLAALPDTEIPSDLPPDFDLNFLAEQFIKFSKLMSCPGCGKIGTLKVWQIRS